jgi:hypothetical protein
MSSSEQALHYALLLDDPLRDLQPAPQLHPNFWVDIPQTQINPLAAGSVEPQQIRLPSAALVDREHAAVEGSDILLNARILSQLMGGEIQIVDRAGPGTTFVLACPIIQQKVAEHAE